MADIKTRESMQTVNTFDRLQNLASKTRSGTEEAKKSINDATDNSAVSENQYAGDQLQGYERGTARLTVRAGDKLGRWGVKETRRNIQKWRNRNKRLDIKVKVPKGNELPAPQQPNLLEAPKTASKTAKTTAQTTKGAVKTTTNTVKTTGKTIKTSAKTAEKTAKATEKAVQATAKAAKAVAKAAKAAAQATVKFVKVAVKAIVAAAKAVVAAVKGIVAAIAAGGWVAVVVILVICLIGGLIAGICSIFTPNDDGGYSVFYMMSVCENQYSMAENEAIQSIPHDYISIEGQEPSLKDVVAIFSVLSNNKGDDLKTISEAKQAEFKAIFDTMNKVDIYCTEHEETVTRQETDSEGNTYEVEETVLKTTLHIVRQRMTVNEAAEVFHFNQKQKEHLATLLSKDFDEMWAVLVD